MAIMDDEWVEIIVPSDVDAGELLGVLNDPHVTGAWHDNGTVRLYWPGVRWEASILTRVEAVLRTLPGRSGQAGPPSRLGVRRIPSQDWNASWAAAVQPVRIGRVVIRPSWAAVEPGPQDIVLVIDPKQAFGTGHHATTHLLVAWLVENIRGGEYLIDLGTGSGVLAMAALRLGARAAVGLDHDPVAIECARESAAANGFGQELQFQVATLAAPPAAGSARADVIVANLDRRTILTLLPVLSAWMARGTIVVLSGLLREDRDDLATAFGAAGVTIRSSRERDGWVALEMRPAETYEGLCERR